MIFCHSFIDHTCFFPLLFRTFHNRNQLVCTTHKKISEIIHDFLKRQMNAISINSIILTVYNITSLIKTIQFSYSTVKKRNISLFYRQLWTPFGNVYFLDVYLFYFKRHYVRANLMFLSEKIEQIYQHQSCGTECYNWNSLVLTVQYRSSLWLWHRANNRKIK